MLALVSVRAEAGRKYYVNYRGVSPLGMACVWAELVVPDVPREKKLRRLLDRCVGELRRLYVRRVIFQEGFPHREYFLSRGFDEAGCSYLLAAMSGEIAAAAAPARRRALLSSPRADRLTVGAAEKLCRSFRHVTLDAPDETFAALEEICARYGVAPEPTPRGRAVDADAAIFMEPPTGRVLTPAACRAVFVRGGREFLLCGREVPRVGFILPEKFRFSLPFPCTPLLSEAVEAGRVRPEDIKISVP